jgi:hypothetical protein
MTPVLEAASELPEGSVIAFMNGRGDTLVRYLEHVGAYWDNYIVLHGHRQITSKSTYKTPASEAIAWGATRLAEKDKRIRWSRRIAYMFGATHIIIDWGGARAPSTRVIEAMIAHAPGARMLARDREMVLLEIGTPSKTAHGPVPSARIEGTELEVAWQMRSSDRSAEGELAFDEDFTTMWTGRRGQRVGDWVEFEADEPRCLTGVGFTPGLRIERQPVAYSVEVLTDSGWKEVASQTRWEVPQTMVEKPGTGMIRIPFPSVRSGLIRISIIEGSPWPWSIAEFRAYGGECP